MCPRAPLRFLLLSRIALMQAMRTLLPFLLVLLLPATAFAQAPASSPSASVRIGAGGAFPMGDDAKTTLYDPGLSLSAGVDVPLATRLSLTVDFGYSRLFLDGDFLVQQLRRADPTGQLDDVDFDFSGGAYSTFAGTAGLNWILATSGGAALYVTGGPGLYYSFIGDPDVEARGPDGEPGEASVSFSRSGSDTALGAHLGAGVQLRMRSGIRLFIEPQFVLLLGDTRYAPVRAGVSFGGLFE